MILPALEGSFEVATLSAVAAPDWRVWLGTGPEYLARPPLAGAAPERRVLSDAL